MFNKFKIIFAGTTKFSAFYLNELIKLNFNISAIFTKPDNLSFRNKKKYSLVKELSLKNNIPLFQPKQLNYLEKNIKKIISSVDIIIIIDYGLIIPESLINLPKLGCINVHNSLLPRWRGPAPVQRAILAGDKKTGVTIIQVNSGIDTGKILYQEECMIDSQDTSDLLSNKLSKIGIKALLITLKKIFLNKKLTIISQNNKFVTYAKKILKQEGYLNWNYSAIQLDRCIRAFNPWPVSFFKAYGKIIKVWSSKLISESCINYEPGTILKIERSGIQVSTGNGILILTELQEEGKRKMSVSDFINSRYKKFTPGMLLR